MKNSRLCVFAFRPERYREMEAYLQEMADQGWKLHWCRGIFAEFEPMGEQKLRYAVDPHAMTSLAYFRRYPKLRLRERMEEGWQGAGRSKGCQILCTADPDLESPVPEQDLKPLIRSTCRLGSMIWVLALLALAWWFLSKPAVVYSLILTNVYLVLAGLAGFLLVYHAVNAILLTLPDRGSRGDPRLSKRYLLHYGMLFFALLAAIALELGGRSDMLLYLMIPVLLLAAGTVLLRAMSGSKNMNRMFVAVSVMSVLMLGLIIFMNRVMSSSNAAWATEQQELLLEEADRLPVLHLADFEPCDDMKNAADVNRSILGDNLLYAEQGSTGYVFTNYTVTRAPFLAEKLFDYLYLQAQSDFGETFREVERNGRSICLLEKANTCLFVEGDTVCYLTAPDGYDVLESADLILEREAAAP